MSPLILLAPLLTAAPAAPASASASSSAPPGAPGASGAASASSPTAPARVPADDPRLLIVGRAVVEGGAARFDWPGVRVIFRMRGPGVRVLLDGTGPDFNVLVDGRPWTKLGTWGAASYDLFLPDPGEHTVTLVRRQGPLYGVTRWSGLELMPGAALLAPPPRSDRRIEFVGDSLTVGYGADALWPRCEDLRPYENASHAFASRAADLLGAEPWIVAASGHGAVRNFADPAPRSLYPMPSLYDRALFSDPAPWTGHEPMDAAVIFLGTNDVSTEPAVPQPALAEGLTGLIRAVVARHGPVPIFLLSDEGRPRITAAVRQAQREVGEEVRVVVLPQAEAPFGCDGHPGAHTHEFWARALSDAMRTALGWGG